MVWQLVAIPLLPWLAAILAVAGGGALSRITRWVSVGMTAIGFGLAWNLFEGTLGGHGLTWSAVWLHEPPLVVRFGVQLDPSSATMLLIVTAVSTLVQIFSITYMAEEPPSGMARFFAKIAFFTGAMLGVVLASNLLEMFFFWELVGLGSYLLVGFWYRKPEAAAAAKKAFVVTRLGDIGFLIAIMILWNQTGHLGFHALARLTHLHALAVGTVFLADMFLLLAAVGKSAQFPLHVWLPDAMEGPTPVSALIHAATMVAAGVYLVARTYSLFLYAPGALGWVAAVGGFTALFAATIAIAQNDIKRVLAYSTVSQLGYMYLGLGLGSYTAGLFHLLTHAFFKALLFLAAGSVIHATGLQDLRQMGGLGKRMKLTATTMAIGGLALAGFPGTAGFWSKDMILGVAFATHQYLWFAVGALGAAITAFYTTRLWLLAFWGEPRSHYHLHRGGLLNDLPLVVLAIPALLIGFLGSPFLGDPFGKYVHYGPVPSVAIDPVPMAISILLVLAGMGTAWVIYGQKGIVESERGPRNALYQTLRHKYYFDEIYMGLLYIPYLGLAKVAAWFDRTIVDGLVNAVAAAARMAGRGMALWQTGKVQIYAIVSFVAIGLLFISVTI